MARWAPVFPSRTTRRLRYATNLTLAGSSGVMASHVFAANGLFDPDVTGTGHQPMGFDQLILSYNHYTVTEARLVATFHNNAASTPCISLKVDGSATPITVADQLIEWGLNEHSVLEAKGSQGSVKVLESRISIARYEGVQDCLDVMELRGSAASNPSEIVYFHIQTWDPGAVTTALIVDVTIEFTATFTEPRVLSESLMNQLKRMIVNDEKCPRSSSTCGR
jgi:hypothetical protein